MLQKAYPYYLANEAVYANTELEVTDKYSGEVATRVAMADAKVIDSAIDWALLAEKPMAALPPTSASKFWIIAYSAFRQDSKSWPRPCVLKRVNRFTIPAGKSLV